MSGINLFWLKLLHRWRGIMQKTHHWKATNICFLFASTRNYAWFGTSFKRTNYVQLFNNRKQLRCTDGEVTLKRQKRVWDELVNFWAQSLPLCLFSFNFFLSSSLFLVGLMRRHKGSNYTPYPHAEQHAWTANFLYLNLVASLPFGSAGCWHQGVGEVVDWAMTSAPRRSWARAYLEPHECVSTSSSVAATPASRTIFFNPNRAQSRTLWRCHRPHPTTPAARPMPLPGSSLDLPCRGAPYRSVERRGVWGGEPERVGVLLPGGCWWRIGVGGVCRFRSSGGS